MCACPCKCVYLLSVYVFVNEFVRVCMCLCTFRDDLESGLSATCVNTRKNVNYA